MQSQIYKVLSLNIRGGFSEKTASILELLNREQPLVLFLQETHLLQESSLPKFPNYISFGNNLSNTDLKTLYQQRHWYKTHSLPSTIPTQLKACRGTLTLVHESIAHKVKQIPLELGKWNHFPFPENINSVDLAKGRITAITITTQKRKTWLFLNIYAPNANTYELSPFYTLLSSFIYKNKTKKVFIGGDLNLPLSSLDLRKSQNTATTSNPLIDLTIAHHLVDIFRNEHNHLRRYTFQNKTKIDHFLVHNSFINRFKPTSKVHKFALGDHKMISLTLHQFFKRPPTIKKKPHFLLYDPNRLGETDWQSYHKEVLLQLKAAPNPSLIEVITKAAMSLPQPQKFSKTHRSFVDAPKMRKLFKIKKTAINCLTHLRKEQRRFPDFSRKTNALLLKLEKNNQS